MDTEYLIIEGHVSKDIRVRPPASALTNVSFDGGNGYHVSYDKHFRHMAVNYVSLDKVTV